MEKPAGKAPGLEDKSTTVTLNGRFPSFLAKVSLNVGIICSGSTAAVASAAHRTAR